MNSVRNFLFLVALLSVAIPIAVGAQERFRIMEYNVENLFDTIPDPEKNDRDFLPSGNQHWTSGRYWSKQGLLARVIAGAGGDSPIELVGLVEVENDTVLAHLTRRTSLARLGYDFLITNGPDERGIDVALLYQPSRFRPIGREDLRVQLGEGVRPTRDVLLVEGLLSTLDTLSVFVAHFPSRRGGKQMTDAYREKVAQVIRHKVDSIQQCRTEALIVIMGDLNDEVQDASLQETLQVVEAEHVGVLVSLPDSFEAAADLKGARKFAEKLNRKFAQKIKHKDETSSTVATQLLYDLSPRCEAFPSVEGTYYFQGSWSKIDHIIVSSALLNTTSPLRCCSPFCHIVAYPFLLEQDHKTLPVLYRPKRMYKGTHYNGGISDHLPLLLELRLK